MNEIALGFGYLFGQSCVQREHVQVHLFPNRVVVLAGPLVHRDRLGCETVQNESNDPVRRYLFGIVGWQKLGTVLPSTLAIMNCKLPKNFIFVDNDG